MTSPTPRELAEEAADLERDTGVTPTIEEIPGLPTRWVLTHANERVRMTLTVQAAKHGRYTWLDSTLEVDGKPRPVADTYSHYVRIFNDPDERPPEREIPDPLPSAAGEVMPPLVSQHYHGLVRSLSPDRVTVGHHGNEWAIDLRSEDGSSFLRLSFRKAKRGKPTADMRITLIVEGRDRSREVAGNLEAAMALLARQATPNTGPAGQGDGQESTSGQGYGSVGVRRHSVIRN